MHFPSAQINVSAATTMMGFATGEGNTRFPAIAACLIAIAGYKFCSDTTHSVGNGLSLNSFASIAYCKIKRRFD
jgi:hypothetical protein